MNKKRFSIVSIIALSVIMFSGVNAQSKTDDKESARVFVQKFYDWYSVLYNADNPGKKTQLSSQQIAMKHGREFFSANLQKALTNYYDTPSEDGDIGLDFDPFIAGQDSGIGYETGNIKKAGNMFLVDVHNCKKGAPRKVILSSDLLVTAEVTKVNGHWMFANFIYPTENGNSNLLAILKNLRKGNNTAAN